MRSRPVLGRLRAFRLGAFQLKFGALVSHDTETGPWPSSAVLRHGLRRLAHHDLLSLDGRPWSLGVCFARRGLTKASSRERRRRRPLAYWQRNAIALTFSRGQSGNPAGAPKGKPHARTARVRKAIADNTGAIVAAIIKDALAGDPTARQLFVHRLMPRHRFVAEPVDLPPAQTVTETRLQLAQLASLAAAGALDLDALQAISRVLAIALGGHLDGLEEILDEKEAQSDHDG